MAKTFALDSAKDIIERKRLDTLNLSEDKFSKVFYFSPDPISITTFKEGRYVEVNDAWVEDTGYKRHEVIGNTAHQLGIWAVAGDRDLFLKEILEHGSTRNSEVQIRIESGEIETVLVSADLIEIGGEPHLICVLKNITERKLMEKKLQESEEKFSKAFHCGLQPMSITTLLEGRNVDVNDAWLETTGYERPEVIGRTVQEIGIYSDPGQRELMIKQIQEQGSIHNVEIEIRMKSGEPRTCLFSGEIIEMGGAQYLLHVSKDITEQKKAEEALLLSQERFLKAFRHNPVIMTIASLADNKYIDVNETFCRITGYRHEEVVGRTIKELNIFGPTMDNKVQIEQKIARKGSAGNIKVRFYTKSGKKRVGLYSTELLYVGGQECLLEAVQDITERNKIKKALRLSEKALRESERRFGEMLENVQLLAIILDIDGKVTFCNNFYLQLLGWNREQVIGSDWYETFVPSEFRERDRHIINMSLQRGSAPFFGESELITGSGSRRTILWSNIILLNPDGSSAGFAGIGEDITERRAGEKRSQELMQELEFTNRELKDFAHIVSHDLKAPLRGIKVLTQWFINDYRDKMDENGKEQLDMLLNRTERMYNLLEGILRYSKLSYMKEEKNAINLNEVIYEVIEMLVPPDNVSIIIENEMPLLKLERTRTQQLFENLISNAIKYMDKPNGQIRISCYSQGEFWQFSIQDNGCGIEAKHFDKIFTIFQTLKSRDEFESTGIGLSIVKKIVEMYGGKIWVESKVGEGSTFHFTLPAHQNCF